MFRQRDEFLRARLSDQQRTLLWILVVLTMAAAVVYGHEGNDPASPPRRVPGAEVYQPTPIPDRIVLTWTGDPAHSQAVTWRTDDSVARAYAELAAAEDGPGFDERAERFEASTQTLEGPRSAARYHTVRFEGLTPSTQYAYRVGDGVNWSEWNHFRTAGVRAEPFTFIYFGDAQTDVSAHWSRVVRAAYRDAPRAAFMLHAGDLIDRANCDGEWGEWFAASRPVHRMIPCIATPGNHEYTGATAAGRLMLRRSRGEPELSRHWRPTFAFPENGPHGLEETTYWIDYQGTRIISLNSNERIEQQALWLEETLRENPCRWTIVTFHHPVYSANAHRDNVEVREAWQPLFDRYGVDLVLQGHDHTYARSVPTANAGGAAGPVYVVSVSGPKMYPAERQPTTRRAAEDTQLYQIIHVDSDELRYEARTATGRLYDAFTLIKRPESGNRLVDRIPPTPERLREATLAGR